MGLWNEPELWGKQALRERKPLSRGDTALSVQFATLAQCRDAVDNLQAILQVAADEAGVYPSGSAYTVDEKVHALEIFSIAYA